MARREADTGILASAVVAAAPALATEAIIFPPARSTGGKLLIETLKLRRSTREYSDRALASQVLSDLLWAAFGVNRPGGDRTALCVPKTSSGDDDIRFEREQSLFLCQNSRFR
jgi:hypothetical protein